MTKLHEEVFRGTVQEALDRFTTPRGEFTLVVEGTPVGDDAGDGSGEMDAEWATAELGRLRGQGRSARDAVREVAGVSGLPRRQVYDLWVRLAEDSNTL
jgi:16S rRNA (cytidine1402-2'-O)-methyltransferase